MKRLSQDPWLPELSSDALYAARWWGFRLFCITGLCASSWVRLSGHSCLLCLLEMHEIQAVDRKFPLRWPACNRI